MLDISHEEIMNINKNKKQILSKSLKNAAQCIRCGTCCQKGGPTLHVEDKKILLAGHIGRENLITIRKGEWAFSPLSGRLAPVQQEFIKIAGKGKGWVCCFYNEEKSSCTLYAHRPLECRLLKCWDTAELLSVVGKDILSRADIICSDDPLMNIIEAQEKECSVLMTEELISVLLEKKNDTKSLAKLTALVHRDITIRSRAIAEFGLSLEAELFLFGRPLFKILSARGFQFMK
jgi:Fe-S-cluster containining protein